MARVLILGGSHSDVPLIESSILHGLEVHTTGNRPEHPGHRFAHSYIPGDFSDKQQMLEIARSIKADFILPGANDFAMISAAYVAEKMGLPGYDAYATVELLHHKDQFKAFAQSTQLPVCRSNTIDLSSEQPFDVQCAGLKPPLMIKPVDLTGGKGISRIDRLSELDTAIAEAQRLSRQERAVAEEWFDGTLHSYSTVVQGGEIVFEYIDTERCMYQSCLVSTSMSSNPVTPKAHATLREGTSRMIRELRLVDGVLHCQFLANGADVRILEYTRRMSGDLYSKVVQLVRGIRHADIFVRSALGRSFSDTLVATQAQHPYVVRHCVTAESNGHFDRLLIEDNILSRIHDIALAVPFGSPVCGDGRSKVATIILSFPTEEQMMAFVASCKITIRCGVKK